jgi:hypothetical protein
VSTVVPAIHTRRGALGVLDNRYLAPGLVTCILLVAHLSFGILESYTRTGLAIVVAIAAELALARAFYGRWPHLASAYITGISVGMLIRSPLAWPYLLGSLLSITSKYVLRTRQGHLWNPSNFGISVVLFLAPATVAGLSIQWGNQVWPMLVIWVLGSIIVWRLGRLHLCLTYVAAFVVFAFVRGLVTGNPWLAGLAPITGPMYQLFIFFMITDPRTTVGSRAGQRWVVIGVAVVEMLLRLGEFVYAPFYALFLVGPLALLSERVRASRAPTRAHA